jgi:hypothetical protein
MLISSTGIFGQVSVYHPFPDSSAVWTIQGEGCCVTSCPPPPTPNPVITDHNISYYIQGDTIINNTTYHKIMHSGSIYHHCLFGSSVNQWQQITPAYIGAIRQDTLLKQVYFLQLSFSQECILYDFDLSIGDTLNYGCMNNSGSCAVVTSIDSVLIGNSYRKRFNLSTNPPYSIIEGIGSTAGFYEPLCPFEYSANLVCFSQNGQTLYPDTTTNCSILSSINEPSEFSLNKVSPNPFKYTTTITTGSDFIGSILYIYNCFGGIQRSVVIKDNTTLIHRESLSSGIYLYRCINEDGKVLSGKLIIN